MTTNNQIVLAEKTISLSPAQFNGAVTDKFTLTGVRQFVAAQAGIVLPKGTKDNPGPTFKVVKEQVTEALVASGKTVAEAQLAIKNWQKVYDKGRSDYKVVGKQLASLCVADPNISITSRPVFGRNGFIGMNHASRLDRSKNSATKVATLEATIAKLEAQLAAKTLPATASVVS